MQFKSILFSLIAAATLIGALPVPLASVEARDGASPGADSLATDVNTAGNTIDNAAGTGSGAVNSALGTGSAAANSAVGTTTDGTGVPGAVKAVGDAAAGVIEATKGGKGSSG